ncbi:MAG: tripartite tricarboxylate transporter substrate binding protein [Alphaproteobacteria bacterium]|nr:MAG: tripartite tricarboxylate transporter substrate binding protein [Alphaproteobacteria bacterium]TMK00169.1 MAG: tripartite tricarboxylate transporter substrate binding protein [Alphaproteobacteria bacterium]
MRRIVILALSLVLSAAVAVAQGRAGDFPSQPLRLIIGFPPGSAADITARLVGAVMSDRLGQQVVVESRPGAGSSIAAEFVARAPADGYTLYIGTSSNVTNTAINPNLRFNFVKDLAPVTPLTILPLILAVHPSLGVSSVEELIAVARSKPGELTYASVGPGTTPHLATELFSVRAKIKLVHVPYQGSPPAVTDLLAARVSMMLGVASTIMPHVEAGRLKALASSSAKRSHAAPNVPTMAEAGLPDFEAGVWFGLMAPAGTPRPVIEKLSAAANAALASDDVVAKLRAQTFEPMGGSPEEFARFIARETVKWSAAAEAAGLKN